MNGGSVRYGRSTWTFGWLLFELFLSLHVFLLISSTTKSINHSLHVVSYHKYLKKYMISYHIILHIYIYHTIFYSITDIIWYYVTLYCIDVQYDCIMYHDTQHYHRTYFPIPSIPPMKHPLKRCHLPSQKKKTNLPPLNSKRFLNIGWHVNRFNLKCLKRIDTELLIIYNLSLSKS